MTNEDLNKLFNVLNSRFFDSRLHDTDVKFGNIDSDGLFRSLFRSTGEIIIRKDLKNHPALVTIVLLHEMVHADLNLTGHVGHEEDKGHGGRFFVEIDRLYQIGAYEGLL